MSANGESNGLNADVAFGSVMTPSGHSKHPLDLPIGLSHRLGDGNVVSFLHCMNDPQAEGHMASHIERRKFLATLGGAAAWPLARAQQPGKLPVIGRQLHRFLRIGRGIGYAFCGDLLRLLSFAFKF
jgi:hypothetical protein